jgi:Pentapeptide repeats (8 copies)
MKPLSQLHKKIIDDHIKSLEEDLPVGKIRKNDLSDTDLSGLQLRDMRFEHTIFRGSNFNRSNLRYASLQGCDLSGASMNDTDLTNVNFKYANLTNVKMYNAILNGADLSYADLSGINLSNADLRQAKGILAQTVISSSTCYVWLKNEIPQFTAGYHVWSVDEDTPIMNDRLYAWYDMAKVIIAESNWV